MSSSSVVVSLPTAASYFCSRFWDAECTEERSNKNSAEDVDVVVKKRAKKQKRSRIFPCVSRNTVVCPSAARSVAPFSQNGSLIVVAVVVCCFPPHRVVFSERSSIPLNEKSVGSARAKSSIERLRVLHLNPFQGKKKKHLFTSMLLRVEVYPHNWTPSAPPPPQTLHACLASAPAENNDGGRVLTVGRKMGDVLLGSDKSVSREHLVVRLASLNKTHQNNNTAVVGDDKEKVIPPPLLATTPEQIAACQADDEHHMCVIVENTGKLGSFVVMEEAPPSSDDLNNKKDDDDSATGDETDDEDKHPASQYLTPAAAGIALSGATRHLLGKKDQNTVTLRPIQNQLVLPALAKRHGRVILQCGKLGSTIVLTRHAIQVVRSSTAAATAAWKAAAHQIGLASASTTNLTPDTNLLLTTTRNTSTKQLVAWCRQVPAVQPTYYQALLQRASPVEPLWGQLDEYAPKDDGNTFWKTVPNPHLWSSFCLITPTDDDKKKKKTAGDAELELLMESAGATAIPVSAEESEDSEAFVATLLPERIAVAAAKSNQTQTKTVHHCLALASRSKLSKQLLAALPQLPTVSATVLARAVTQQRLLQDDQGNLLGLPVNINDNIRDSSSSIASLPAQDASGEDDAGDGATAKPEAAAAGKRKRAPDESVSRKSQKDATSSHPHFAEAVEADHAPPKDVVVDKDDEDDDADELKSDAKDPVKQTTASRKRKAADDAVVPVGKRRTAAQQTPASRQKKAADEAVIPVGKRKTLQKKGTTGWFRAAPSGAQRRAYQKTRDEIKEATGLDQLGEVAVTESCPSLVLAPTATNKDRRQKRQGPDYRAFRKNTLAAPRSRIVVLRSVLPKETEQQMEYEHQRRALDEQQRRADELFRDPRGASRSRRRR